MTDDGFARRSFLRPPELSSATGAFFGHRSFSEGGSAGGPLVVFYSLLIFFQILFLLFACFGGQIMGTNDTV
jgi:hypothetical protein